MQRKGTMTKKLTDIEDRKKAYIQIIDIFEKETPSKS